MKAATRGHQGRARWPLLVIGMWPEFGEYHRIFVFRKIVLCMFVHSKMLRSKVQVLILKQKIVGSRSSQVGMP